MTVFGRKNCAACGRWKLLHEFSSRTWNSNGTIKYVQSYCRTCHRGKNRAVYALQMNGDLSADARRKSWRRAQRKRMGLKGDGVGYEERAILRSLQAAYRAAVEDGEVLTDMCERIGWGVDTTRLKRALGLSGNEGYVIRGVDHERGALLARAIGVDPIDVGL